MTDLVGSENMFGNIDDALNRAHRILGLPEAQTPLTAVPVVARERGGGGASPKSAPAPVGDGVHAAPAESGGPDATKRSASPAGTPNAT
jgi:hypothetical protein